MAGHTPGHFCWNTPFGSGLGVAFGAADVSHEIQPENGHNRREFRYGLRPFEKRELF
jgi:hypothetical protein